MTSLPPVPPEASPAPRIPPRALDAAVVAIHDADCTDRCSGSALGHCYDLAIAALEAAGPHLAAAEREAIIKLAGDCDAIGNGAEGVVPFADLIGRYRHDWRAPAPVPAGQDEAENLRHALKEAGKEMDRRYEMGVAAEREACAQLADERRAGYVVLDMERGAIWHPFAVLLRETRPAGNRAERNTP